MKAHYLVSAIAAFTVLAAISCTQVQYPESSGIEMTFIATYEDQAPATRTELGENGSVLWSPGDEVSIFKDSGTGGGFKFVSLNSSPAKTVEFKGTLDGLGFLSSGEYFWAVYPYSESNSCSGSAITAVLSETQTAVPGAFAEKCHPVIARSANTNLAFYAVAGGLKFTVSRSDIKSVSIKGNNGEALAGSYSASFSTDGKPEVTVTSAQTEVSLVAPGGAFTPGESYFISLLPATLSKGFTITLNAGTQMGTVVSGKSLSVKRSIFGVLNDLDTKASWKAVEPEAIDLGLPSGTLWASCNLGATNPEEYGDYYAWGETEPKASYSWDTYMWGGEASLTKYNYDSSSGTTDYKTLLELEDDAAHANLGGDWRIPTKEEWIELWMNCTLVWTDDYNGTGIKGLILTGPNSNSIFLPAAGGYNGSSIYDSSFFCYYWTSILHEPNETHAFLFYRSKNYHTIARETRFKGFSVRPVKREFVPVTDISVYPTKFELEVKQMIGLSTTVSPDNATSRSVAWASSDPSVAMVNSLGEVTTYSTGTATIYAYASNGLYATCTVTVKNKIPYGVDLGLPSGIRWASWNVGANKQEEYGDYFAWGETEPKDSYSWNTYLWENSNGTLKKYNSLTDYGTVDFLNLLESGDDAASASYGSPWRMPTKADWEELRKNCKWTWSSDFNGTGVKGYVVSGKASGFTDNSIFLPAAGVWSYTTYSDAGVFGHYWSSSLYTDNPFTSWAESFYSSDVELSDAYRYLGYSVRAVYE